MKNKIKLVLPTIGVIGMLAGCSDQAIDCDCIPTGCANRYHHGNLGDL